MRIKQFIFTLMVMFACSSFVAVAQDEPGAGSVAVEGSSVFDGEGTEQSPYIIDSSDKLIALRTNVNAGETYAGVYFKLASDIALSGEWTAIGNGTRSSKTYTGNAFKGVFDGGGKTISGMAITSTTEIDAAIGLFGVVDGGTVKNLNLTDVNINVPSSDLAGAAIGMMLNGATAEAITVSGAVVAHDGVGGIAGRLVIDGTIANCTNNASVTTDYGGIGGIVGKAYYDDASNTSIFAKITNCVNKGTITARIYAGGIAGLARANVSGCVNEGTIVGGTQTAGIVGQLIAAGTVSDNENKGKVSGTGHVGGIIGDYTQSGSYHYNKVTISSNINRGELYATEQCAAIMGINNVDGFTDMTATGNLSYYYVEGLELFGNPEDMVIDETNKFVATAKIGETEYYAFYAAVKAAQVGDVITLLEDADLAFTDNPMYNNIYASEFDLNGKTLTIKEGDLRFDNVTIKNGNIIVEPGLSGGTAVFLMYSKNLTFDAVKITATGCAATYLVGLEGTSNLKLLNGSEILIDNATAIDTDIICSNNGATENTIVIENSKVTVNNIDGRVFFGGNYTVKNSEVSLAGISKAGFRINAGQTLSIEGTSNVNIDGEPRDGGIHLVDITSTYIKEETATVNATINEIPAIAKIGTTKYATLQDALNAAAAGTGEVTVEIIKDVDLTGTTWAPVTVSGPGYPLVTVEGNEHTITGLTDMLFAATWAGKSGLIIKNLTIANSAIVNDENDANGNVGVGAFIGYPQASATITLDNCHLKNSSVKGGHWTGGLIGMAGGYNGNDGPVFMNLTIKNCSVTDSEITGKGSAGALIGHGSCSAWTNVVIENTTVEDNTITSTGSSANKAGSVMGTIGAAGQPTTVNGETKTGGAYISAVVANNNVTSGGTEITTIYGRQGTETGMLYIVGGSYDKYPIEENVAYAAVVDGYALFKKADGTYGVTYLIVDGAGDYKFECENAESATVENLTYTRTLASDGFNALFVPFGFSAGAAPGFEFFKFDEACTANGEKYLVVSTVDYVNANAPYLVRPIGEGEEAKKLNIQISNAILLDSKTNPGSIEVPGEEGSIYKITGTYSQLNGAEDVTIEKSYGISVNGYFALIGDGSEVGGTLGAFRFYMQLPEGANARNIGIRIGGESDDATGIVETENGKVKTEIYDLSGRRVQNAQKGIFIVNGKKVVK